MYRARITMYAGGEVRLTSSPCRVPVLEESCQGDGVLEGQDESDPPLLDYSSQLETVRAAGVSGYGSLPVRVTRFTNEAKKTIQRCARALDEEVSRPSEILFLTGTLPGTGQEQYLALAQWSSYVVHRLKAWVAKRVPQKFDFYCWELQKRGALHLHYACYCPDDSIASEIVGGFHSQWCRLLDYVSDKTGVDLYENTARGFSHKANKENVQARAEFVHSSVGAYLGKYLSKSCNGANDGAAFAPCRWWGVSRPLRNLEASKRKVVDFYYMTRGKFEAQCEDFMKWLQSLSAVCHSWSNKFSAGFGGVGYGVDRGLFANVVKLITGKEFIEMNTQTKVLNSWAKFKDVLIHVEMNQPNWFGSMTRRLNAFRKWDEIQRFGVAEVNSPAGIAMMQHMVWSLSDLLKSNERINVEYIKYPWKASLLATMKEMQESLDTVYREEYGYHSEEDYYSLMVDEQEGK